MALTRFRMNGVVLFVVALSALEAYHWDIGPKDKAKITACVGGSAFFPWSIVTGLGETILHRGWWFQAPGKQKTRIAVYISNHFYATDSVRARFLPNSGMSLHYARPHDSGNYSVQVEIEQANSSLASVWRTAMLSVTDRPPATQDGSLYVTLGYAVRDDVTQDWTLQLHCGKFVDLGQPPVDVVWKTPSGEARNSSYEVNGTFVLSVSSPVQGGYYSCHLPPSAPAVRCLAVTSPLTAAARLYVDVNDVRLSFLESHQRELEQANKDLLEHQAMQTSQQNGIIEEIKADYLDLTTQLSALTKTLKDVVRRINPENCEDWLKIDPRSGIRTVYISGEPISVYCDQTTDNGGWIVFQRRQDASVDFYRKWTEYRMGFGDPEGNFWLGLDALHSLTTSRRYQLRVDLEKWDGTRGYATYSGFYVTSSDTNFTLHFDNFTGGNAGDSLSYHRGSQFSTKDKDHDTWFKFCAQVNHGAWWYKGCHYSSLNGGFKPSGRALKYNGIIWATFGGDSYSLKFTEMKIRPM